MKLIEKNFSNKINSQSSSNEGSIKMMKAVQQKVNHEGSHEVNVESMRNFIPKNIQ
jgi:hypothetical protein